MNVFVLFRLFAEEINWGRVAALMCLAYRITMTVVKEKAKKFAQFLRVIVSHVVRFIKEKIAGWIASQGGWVSSCWNCYIYHFWDNSHKNSLKRVKHLKIFINVWLQDINKICINILMEIFKKGMDGTLVDCDGITSSSLIL